MTENRGLYSKLIVKRRDGRDEPGGDREDASYFVLDVEHVPHAFDALLAYAEACEGDLPDLAAALRDVVYGYEPYPTRLDRE